MVNYKCIECRWYDNKHESLKELAVDNGYCRKHKPIPILKGDRYYGTWPIVNRYDFCGEYREGNMDSMKIGYDKEHDVCIVCLEKIKSNTWDEFIINTFPLSIQKVYYDFLNEPNYRNHFRSEKTDTINLDEKIWEDFKKEARK